MDIEGAHSPPPPNSISLLEMDAAEIFADVDLNLSNLIAMADDLDFEFIGDDFNLYDYILGEPTGLKLNDFANPHVVNFVAGKASPASPPRSSDLPAVQIPVPAVSVPILPQIEAPVTVLEDVPLDPVDLLTMCMERLSLGVDPDPSPDQTMENEVYVDVGEGEDVQICSTCLHLSSNGTQEQLQKHCRAHNNFNDSSYVKRKCGDCDKIFKNSRDELSHKSMENSKIPCLVCDQSFRCLGPWSTHFLKEHLADTVSFQCQLCYLVLSSRSNLSNHYKTHLKCLRYRCLVCESSYRTVKGLYNHLFSHEDRCVQEALRKLALNSA